MQGKGRVTLSRDQRETCSTERKGRWRSGNIELALLSQLGKNHSWDPDQVTVWTQVKGEPRDS
jgi:hypothetical protein